MYSNLRNYRIIVSASFIDSNLPISKIRILLTLSSNYPRQWELKYFLVNHSIFVQLLPQSNYMFRNHTSLLRKNEKRSLCLIRLDEKSEVINSSLPWHDRSKQRNNEQGEIYKIERNPAFHVARLWRTCYEDGTWYEAVPEHYVLTSVRIWGEGRKGKKSRRRPWQWFRSAAT